MEKILNTDQLSALRSILINLEEPIAKRTQAAFRLRTDGRECACRIIEEALANKADCDLMRHELAYIAGQMQFISSCGLLEQVLRDESDSILVRHECAEALGAIANQTSEAVLLEYSSHAAPEIAETCQIALDRIQWKKQQQHMEQHESAVLEQNAGASAFTKSLYLSVDPAPPLNGKLAVAELTAMLMDSSASLFHRYRAMFSLRDLNSDAAALGLVRGFDDASALFRHEIAFVLGQMQRPVTADGES
jgi:deoxyhypusine monooxygenase